MDQTLEPGTLLAGRYCIKAVIAVGGMGAVYEALDERFGRPVAVKVVLRELAKDPRLVARFEREAGALARLSHPSFVHVHDFGATDDGVSYLVMERVTGTNLGDLLSKEGPLAPERAADLVEQALGALEVAHEAGIVHRDLKPANLMVIASGASRELVKVLDFGVAQLRTGEAYSRLTRTGSIVGTPSFMSPEQARGEEIDARSDLYAMGVVLYCLLTGKRPFEGTDLAEILHKVRNEPAPSADVRRPGVPPQLARIVDRAMEKNASRRYASAREMAQALVTWRASRVSGGTPQPASPREAVTLVEKPTPLTPAPPLPQTNAPATHAPPSVSAPEPSSTSRWRTWLGRLSWLALAALVLACALSAVGLAAGALLYAPEAWLGEETAGSAPHEGPTPATTTTTNELGGPSGACDRAFACCNQFRRTIAAEAACEVVHQYDQRPRALCDQVRDTYRDALDQQQLDSSMCGQ
jgi:serine/threonine-protein kinase